MFVAYILTNQRELKLKMFTRLASKDQFFKYGVHEYEINPKYIYFKKFLFIKLFTWSMYKQGERKPLTFEDITVAIANDEIPLDDLTYWENRLKKDQLTKIAELMAIIGCILAGVSAYFSYNIFNEQQNMIEYLKLMGKEIQEIYNGIKPPVV